MNYPQSGRTTENVKILQVQKMDGDFKDDKTPQSGWITTTIKELSAKRTDHRNGYKS